MKKLLPISLLLLVIAVGTPAGDASGATHILNVRHWAAPEYSRVVLDTSDEAKYTVSKDGKKVTLDFKDAVVDEDVPLQSFLNKPGIDRIVVMALPGNFARVEIYLHDNVETKIFKLKKFMDKPDRIVVDIELPEAAQKASEDRLQFRATKKDKIVIIDPGHGGEDPGAIGRKGTREKDIVLKIGRTLKETLNKQPGYRAFLTRNGDYYVPFNRRLRIAREYGADLFVSVHADAVRDRKVRGGSVYALSTRGASSEAARLLASRENVADIVGGYEGDDTTDQVDLITLDMVQTNTFNLSRSFGSRVLANLKDVNPLKFQQVQSAPFRVLKLPEVPSVLVETAYISNPVEEQLLKTPAFQQEVADAIAASVYEFLPASSAPAAPAPATVVKKEEPQTQKESKKTEPAPLPAAYTSYVVKKGDTLEKIALRHHTTVGELVKSNRIQRNDPLYVGRKLKVPAAAPPEEEASPDVMQPVIALYTVRKGDTLEKIARQHNMTTASLLKLNAMKPEDSFYVNQKLKVRPERPENGKRETAAAAKRNVSVYAVRKGDTVDRVAARHQMNAAELRRLNGMKPQDILYIGQKIKVYADVAAAEKAKRPGAAAPPTKEKKPAVYVVKKGDTLDKIARRHNTTVAALVKINKLKANDPLYVNRKLKLPQEEDI